MIPEQMKIVIKSFSMILILSLTISGEAKTEDIYFTTTPTISPDATEVVFSCESDLWIVKISGGTAYRLTAMEGEEKYPRFSPDGQWIAFSGSQEGNSNVYVMPAQGGEIKQLTFHEANDRVDSWSWDSKYIYFTSGRYNYFTGFKVNREGGTPRRLFDNYFNTTHGLVEHPLSRAYYFTDTDESLSFASRKGYKGEYNPDIKSYNPDTKEFNIHTSYRGKDFWHTMDQQGNIYFVSDRFNGEYNLYQLKNEEKIKLTEFETSIKTPQVSANGEKIVFEKDYQLFTFSVPDKKIEKINIRLFGNNTLKIEQDFKVNGKITFFDISPDGKKFAFISRGELFVSDIKGKFIRKLETGNGRVVEVKWLKDNKILLFTQTVNGWLNLFNIKANNDEKAVQLTYDEVNSRNITLNNEMTQAVYLSGPTHLNIMDIQTFKTKTVVKDEIWAFFSTPPYFSPDSTYIVFTAHRNFEQDLFLHHLDSGQTVNLTNSGISDSEPFWSPDGKYIYFTSDRFRPFFPRGGNSFRIYRLPLHKYTKPFKSTELDKLFLEEEKSGSSKRKEKNQGDTLKKGKQPLISIDPDELFRHWEQISPPAGTQGSPYVINKKDETIVLYLSNHDGEAINLWKTTIKPFTSNKTVKIKGAATYNPLISSANDKIYALVKGKIGEVDIKSNTFKPMNMNFTFSRNLRSEFSQMFFELWAGLQENFYDEKFHEKDWKKIKESYRRFLPHIRSRSNLRTLISDMLGELNSSHMGFRSRGDEEKAFHSMKTMETGLVFQVNNPYKVSTKITDSPVDKKDIDIKPGDELTAVNHQKVDPGVNREYYFRSPSMNDELSLTFKREHEQNNESGIFTVKIHPITSRANRKHLYDEWIRQNQRYVDEKSNRRIAYIYMKNMKTDELNNFFIEMTTEWYNREGLILDIRYNTGGNVHDVVLNFLSQKPYTLWKYRSGKFAPQPNFAPAARPIVLLINEQSLSDAELTTVGFKKLKLGKVIGTETYRWLIYTGGNNLVDGSYYRLPSWGCYTLDKENIEKTGVKPDLYIKTTFKDRLEGKDPQLEAAVQEILKQLK